MTREDIIKLAKECGNWSGQTVEMNDVGLERFAALVAAAERDRIADEAKHIIKRAEARGAAAEREACAKVCDEVVAKIHHQRMFGRIVSLDRIAAAIRARKDQT